jgi:two-component system cell cycle sensor histidine kinase/response regulator CckA
LLLAETPFCSGDTFFLGRQETSAGNQVIDRALFQAAIETAPEAVFWMDRDGRFVYVNERACTSLGYTREELSALHVWDIDPNVDRTRWSRLWSEISVGLTMETQHLRKDGSLVPVDVSAKDLDVDGTRLRVAFVRDMSERKAVTDALLRTQSAVDRAREAIFWIRSDARFVYVNDAACQSLEYAREELLGMTVPDIDPNVTWEKWAEDWRRSRESRSFVVETMHRSKSGRTFPVEVAVNFMQFEGEEYNCVYTRDISERKRAEEEKARLESQLLHAQKLETVGRLAGGVAPDFTHRLGRVDHEPSTGDGSSPGRSAGDPEGGQPLARHHGAAPRLLTKAVDCAEVGGLGRAGREGAKGAVAAHR